VEEIMTVGLSTEEKKRFSNVRTESDKLGVLDINFSAERSGDSLDCYERTLEIIKKNKQRYDQNAGEA
jgi:hypothetical protein